METVRTEASARPPLTLFVSPPPRTIPKPTSQPMPSTNHHTTPRFLYRRPDTKVRYSTLLISILLPPPDVRCPGCDATFSGFSADMDMFAQLSHDRHCPLRPKLGEAKNRSCTDCHRLFPSIGLKLNHCKRIHPKPEEERRAIKARKLAKAAERFELDKAGIRRRGPRVGGRGGGGGGSGGRGVGIGSRAGRRRLEEICAARLTKLNSWRDDTPAPSVLSTTSSAWTAVSPSPRLPLVPIVREPAESCPPAFSTSHPRRSAPRELNYRGYLSNSSNSSGGGSESDREDERAPRGRGVVAAIAAGAAHEAVADVDYSWPDRNNLSFSKITVNHDCQPAPDAGEVVMSRAEYRALRSNIRSMVHLLREIEPAK